MTNLPPSIKSGDLPLFHRLGEYVFQDLCCDLFEAEESISTCAVYGTRGQLQRGIDLLAHRIEGDGIEVGQCKCYDRFQPADIIDASDEFFKHWDHWSGKDVKRFILFVACDLATTQQQDEIRKAVKQLGKELSTHRFTAEEKTALTDIVYTYARQGLRTSENEITRIGVNWLLLDYRQNGANSVLARLLERLHG